MVYLCLCVYLCVSLCVCMCGCLCICMCAYVCACVCMCMYVLHVCVHVCIHAPGKDLKLVFGRQQGATALWELVCRVKTNNASIHKVSRAVNRAWTWVRWVWKNRYQNIMLNLNTSARVEENTPNIPNQGKECSTDSFPMTHEIPKAVPNPSVPKPRVAPFKGLSDSALKGKLSPCYPYSGLALSMFLLDKKTTKVMLRTC